MADAILDCLGLPPSLSSFGRQDGGCSMLWLRASSGVGACQALTSPGGGQCFNGSRWGARCFGAGTRSLKYRWTG